MRHASGIVQVACMVILSLIGWSAQPGHASPSSEAFSEAYRLPDGSFAVICSQSGRHDKGTAAIHCDQCLPAGPIALPSPGVTDWLPERRWHVARPAPRREQLATTLAIDRATSRGPPSPA
jgi:hypothetical protein